MAYLTLQSGTSPAIEIEIKRSRFLGFAARVETEDSAREFLAAVRQGHREARHVCHAFVIGQDRLHRSSDDGEPAGTAGMPILNAIINRTTPAAINGVSDVAVCVVRYFGGIKLGAGGLVQAYSQTAAELLDSAEFVLHEQVENVSIVLPTTESVRVETSLRNLGYNLRPTEYQTDTGILSITVREAGIAGLQEIIASLTSGSGELRRVGKSWQDSPVPTV